MDHSIYVNLIFLFLKITCKVVGATAISFLKIFFNVFDSRKDDWANKNSFES